MTTPSVSSADAYALAFFPAAAAVALANFALLDAVAALGGDEKLGHAVQFSRGAVQISAARANESLKLLTAAATRCRLSVPERPAAGDPRAWLDTVRSMGHDAVGAAGSPAASAAFQTGIAAGDLHLALWIGRNLIYLRTAAPDQPLLRQRAAEVDRALDEGMRRVGELLGRAAAAPTAAAITLRALFAQTPDLVAAVTTDAFKQYFDWATQISAQLESLGGALPA